MVDMFGSPQNREAHRTDPRLHIWPYRHRRTWDDTNMANMTETTQPSTANIAAACAILAGVTGYMLGQAKSLGFFGGSPVSQPTRSEKDRADDSEDESSNEEDSSKPADFPGQEECKMVLVVRTDLGMTKGMATRFYG